jgi:hypothetical protein
MPLQFERYTFPTAADNLVANTGTLSGGRRNKWKDHCFSARQTTAPLRDFQGFGVNSGLSHLSQLNLPVANAGRIIFLGSEILGLKPKQLLLKVSEWNSRFNCHVYLCANVIPYSAKHAAVLARFDDPAYRRVFKGLIVCNSNECDAQYAAMRELLSINDGVSILFLADKFALTPLTASLNDVKNIKFIMLDANTSEYLYYSHESPYGVKLTSASLSGFEQNLEKQMKGDFELSNAAANADASTGETANSLAKAEGLMNELMKKFTDTMNLNEMQKKELEKYMKNVPGGNDIEKAQRMLSDLQNGKKKNKVVINK